MSTIRPSIIVPLTTLMLIVAPAHAEADDPMAGWNAEGLTLISAHYFTDGLEVDGWVAGNRTSLVEDPTVPVGPPRIAQRLYRQGDRAGAGVAMYRPVEGRPNTLHAGIWVKYSENFVQHPSNITKLYYFWSAGKSKVILTPYGNDLVLRTLVRHSPGNTRYMQPNKVPPAEARLIRGRWHKVECRVESASAPQMGEAADGRIRVWLDDVLVADYTGLDTHFEGETRHWRNLQWNTIWGGVDAQVPHDMFMYAGALFLAGSE